MAYELETISKLDWEHIRTSADDTLKETTATPCKRVVDLSTGSFLVEIGNDDHRGETYRRCFFFFSGRTTFIAYSPCRVCWTAWKGIEEHEISRLNRELVQAISILYGCRAESISIKVSENPFARISKEELILRFDNAIGAYFSLKKLKLYRQANEDLEKGRATLFKWRFYWLKWRGIPQYLKVDSNLINNTLSGYADNPERLALLLEHLAEGGEKYCEETKYVLKYLKNVR